MEKQEEQESKEEAKKDKTESNKDNDSDAGELEEPKEEKNKESRKKWWLILLLLLLLFAGAAFAWYWYFGKSDESSSNDSSANKEEQKQLTAYSVYHKDKAVFGYDKDGTKKEFFTLNKQVRPLGTFVKDNKPWLIYLVGNIEQYQYSGVEITDGTTTTAIYNFTPSESAFYFALSPDGSFLAYFDGPDPAGQMKVKSLPVQTGSTPTVIIDNADPEDLGPLIPVGWSSDNKEIYLQEYTCMQCDGPSKPILHSVAVDTKVLTKNRFKASLANAASGRVSISPSGKQALVTAESEYLLGYTYQDLLNNKIEVYLVDLATNTSSILFKKTIETDAQVLLAGWSSDEAKAYAAVSQAVNSSGEFAETQFNRLLKLDLLAKSSSDYGLEITMLSDTKGYVVSVNSVENSLFVSTGKYGTPDQTYALYKLSLAGGDATVLIDPSNKSIDHTGFITLEN